MKKKKANTLLPTNLFRRPVSETGTPSVTYRRTLSTDEVEFIESKTKGLSGKKKGDDANKGINDLAQPILDKLARKVLSNDMLEAIAPEIAQSGQIHISSLLSPNDMQTNNFTIEIRNTEEPPNILQNISGIVSEHFGEQLRFRAKMSTWIYDALYRHGAKAVMVIPSSSIPKETRREQGAYEDLKKLGTELNFENELAAELAASLENLEAKPTAKRSELINVSKKAIATFAAELEFSGGVLTDIKTDEQASKDLHNKLAKSALEDLGMPAELIDIAIDEENKTATKDGDEKKEPIIMCGMLELPYESVAPVIIDGAPRSPIGFIVAINEHGCPLRAEKKDLERDVTDAPDNMHRIEDLYKSIFGNTRMTAEGATQDTKMEFVEKSLSKYFSQLINKMARSKMGTTDVSVELTSSMINMLFMRSLRKKKCKFIFVPNDLMMYLAYEYNDDGTGKALIDDIIMPLSFKTTLLVTRILALIESSTPRKRITVGVDEDGGNIQEIMRMIRTESKKNRSIGVSHDPATVIKNHVDRELEIYPDKIPGLSEFKVESQEHQVTYPQPDDGLIETIDNMITLQLGATASSLNKLKEDDFATSVTSNNLFLSNIITLRQEDTCAAISKLMRTMIRFDTNLSNQIKEALETTEKIDKEDVQGGKSTKRKKKEDEEEGKEEEGKIDDSTPEGGVGEGEVNEETISLDERFKQVVEGITMTLPRPNIVGDKAQFNELREYVSIVRDITDAIFDEDSLPESTDKDGLRAIKGIIRSKIIGEYIKETNAFQGILAAADDLPLAAISTRKQVVTNLQKMLADQKKAFEGEEGGGGGSSW